MLRPHILTLAAALSIVAAPAVFAQTPPPPAVAGYNAELARTLGADERGMRSYVLVILKTGPTKVPAGAERDEMFKGHFANIERLAKAGTLAVAGPFADSGNGWRGLYLFAVTDVEDARKLVATDPVIVKGEMVAEFHPWYGSAALMTVPATHDTLVKKPR
jgi:uncharacterized protein YciI